MSEIVFISAAVGLGLAFGAFAIVHLAFGDEMRRDSEKEERDRMKRFMEKYSRAQNSKEKQPNSNS